MLRYFVRRVQRLWTKTLPASTRPARAAPIQSDAVPTFESSVSVPASSSSQHAPPPEIDVLATLISSPPPPSSPEVTELSSLAYTNQRILQQIDEEKRFQQEINEKLEALERKRLDEVANRKKWNGELQRRAAKLISNEAASSTFTSVQSNPPHPPLSSSPVSNASSSLPSSSPLPTSPVKS